MRGADQSRASNDTSRDIARYTVPEAGRRLGISSEAVRNRLSRGTLKSVKESGTVCMLLENDRARHTADTPNDIPGVLFEEMRGRIESLERQLERANERDRENRRIIAALTSRMPAIVAPEFPETATEQPGRVERRRRSQASRRPQSVRGGAGYSKEVKNMADAPESWVGGTVDVAFFQQANRSGKLLEVNDDGIVLEEISERDAEVTLHTFYPWNTLNYVRKEVRSAEGITPRRRDT
jgi:hypothetical protein